MNLPAVYYSAELDVCVIVRAPAIDIETGECGASVAKDALARLKGLVEK